MANRNVKAQFPTLKPTSPTLPLFRSLHSSLSLSPSVLFFSHRRPIQTPGIFSVACCIMGDFTIQISSNLVSRLTDDGEKLKKKTKKPKTKISREPERLQRKVSQKQIPDDSETHKGTAATGWPIQPSLFLPVTPPVQSANAELDAIRSVLQESERVVEKLLKQEENIVQEVTERAKDLRDKEFKLPNQKPMPCVAENNDWQACYKEHVKEPLKCAHLAQNFANCARGLRQQVSSADK